MDTPEELVAELRSVISTFRTTDFDHLVSQGGSIEELGDALVEICLLYTSDAADE